MKISMKGYIWGLMLAGAVSIAAGYSNPIEGGSSETVTNHWDAGDQLTVGRSTANNMLSITNGGTVFVGVGVIGELTGSDGNSAVVSGSGSSWTNTADLTVGNVGSSNSLIIEDGGVVYSANGFVGVDEASANNSVVVRGTNSVWENSDTLMVGDRGDGNSLTISDGGTVNSKFGMIGFGNPATGNSVLVSGAGSTWNNATNLLIGSILNSGNSLSITNGGKVVVGGQLDIYQDNDLYLNDGGWLKITGHADLDFSDTFHYNAGSTLEVTGSVWFNGRVADRNTLIFQGENATWLNSDISTLYVGDTGDDNTVIISNKASISTLYTVIENDGNRILVTGAGAQFETLTNLYIYGSDNELLVQGGAEASAITGYVGNASSAHNNRIVVDGAGSSFLNSSAIFLGYEGGSESNRLEVLNGGNATLGNTYIGFTNALYSSVLVDGSNSTLSATELHVGESSQFNTFSVVNGAQASSGTSTIGTGTNGNGNLAIVTGTGSSWDAGSLTIGGGGATNFNNVLTIENGGKVVASELAISTNGTGNALNLNAGGWLTVVSDMDGDLDGFNWAALSTLEVQGSLTNMYGAHDGNNTLILSSGGIWSNDIDVAIGYNNSSNQLRLVGGGMIDAVSGTIGQNAGSDFNTVEVTGSGSEWFNWSDFIVGEFGSDNILTISNSATVESWDDTIIGAGPGADRNSILVHGADTDLDTPFGTIVVGYNGFSNTLSALDGGLVNSGNGVIGVNSVHNRVLIDGAGSQWNMSSMLIVGMWGATNELMVSNGGVASVAGNTYIGFTNNAIGNRVVVDGAGSRLYNTINIHVGQLGSGNELAILNGAKVYDTSGLLGTDNGADHNSALIDGSGSLWHNDSLFFAGQSGSSNTVTVQNGARLVDTSGYIGRHTTAIGNRVIVDDAEWINSGDLFVGWNGSGNSLLITNGAVVISGESRIGAEGYANDNEVLVTGTGSVWNVSKSLMVGNDLASNNTLVVENGGSLVVDDTLSVGSNNWLYVNDGGILDLHNVDLSSGIVFNDGSTLEVSGELTGHDGIIKTNTTLSLVGPEALWTEVDSILIQSNGTLNAAQGATVSATNSISLERDALLAVGDGSSVNAGTSIDAFDAFVTVGSNAVVSSGGAILLDGSVLTTGDGFDFDIGASLLMTNNSSLTAGELANIDIVDALSMYSGSDLTVGSNTAVIVGGELLLSNSDFTAGNNATVEAGTISVQDGSELYIAAGATVSSPSNYMQQANATLTFGMDTNSAGEPISGRLNVTNVANFADGASFIYTDDMKNLSFDETYTNTLVSAGSLVIGEQTNATTADLYNFLNTDGSWPGISYLVENHKIMAVINRLRLSEWVNPDSDDLRAVLDEIEDWAIAGDPLADRQVGLIYDMGSEQANVELSQFYTRGIPTYQHMDGVLEGLKQIEKRTSEMLMETADYVKPVGVYGPAAAEGQWRGWISAYGNHGTRDASSGLSGYDADTYGTVLGVDKSLNNMIVGLSGGLAGSTIDQDDGDTSDASTAYGALYATIRLKEVDWDLIGSYGSSSIESSSGTSFGSDAETDASTMVLYIGASEEAISGSFTLTPVAAFQMANFSQDGYDEVSTNAVGRAVDSYDRWSYKSILGANIGTVKSLQSFDLIMRAKVSWQHEFNADIDTLNYTLIGGTDPHYFTIQAPVEDAIDLGVSLGALFGENLEVSLGLNGRYAKEFTAISYNGKIQYSF